MSILYTLQRQANLYNSEDNEDILTLADKAEDEVGTMKLAIVLGAYKKIARELAQAADTIADLELNAEDLGALSQETLTEMATIAAEFDRSGDPLLQKQASVLDEILLTIGAQPGAFSAKRAAQDEEVEKIKKRKESEIDLYGFAKEKQDKWNKVEEAKKAIAPIIKEYRSLEGPLSTRTCPDHPGAQMARIAEYTYQCHLDKKIYNYQAGYTTMKGNKIPGGDVSNQTSSFHDHPPESVVFNSREGRLAENG